MNFQKIMDGVSKNSPTILTVLGVVGLVNTVVMAIKATPEASFIINDLEESYRQDGLEPNYKDIVKATWKCYVPTVISGGTTIACIIGSNHINIKRNAALISLYSMSDSLLKEYKQKVVETIGKTKERKIKEAIKTDKLQITPEDDTNITNTGKGDTLCYDVFSGRKFRSDIEYIRQTINKLSFELMSEDFITLNEVYDHLGLDNTKMGELLGWHIDDGLIEPEFSSLLTSKGTPCLVLDFTNEPRYKYNDY